MFQPSLFLAMTSPTSSTGVQDCSRRRLFAFLAILDYFAALFFALGLRVLFVTFSFPPTAIHPLTFGFLGFS